MHLEFEQTCLCPYSSILCSAEKHQILIIQSVFSPYPGLKLTIYCTGGTLKIGRKMLPSEVSHVCEYANHYITDVEFFLIIYSVVITFTVQ